MSKRPEVLPTSAGTEVTGSTENKGLSSATPQVSLCMYLNHRSKVSKYIRMNKIELQWGMKYDRSGLKWTEVRGLHPLHRTSAALQRRLKWGGIENSALRPLTSAIQGYTGAQPRCGLPAVHVAGPGGGPR